MKKIWSTLDFFSKLHITIQVQSKSGHCILCGWTSCCYVPGGEVELLVQAPDTPLTALWEFSLLPTVVFWNSFLGLGTISIFHNNCSVEHSRFFLVLVFFFPKRYSPLAISYPNIIVEASKEKYLLQEILQKWKKTLEGPHWGCRNSTDSSWVSSFPMVTQLCDFSLGRAGYPTQVFSFSWWLTLGNKSWNHPEVTLETRTNAYRSRASQYFLPCRSHRVPRGPW